MVPVDGVAAVPDELAQPLAAVSVPTEGQNSMGVKQLHEIGRPVPDVKIDRVDAAVAQQHRMSGRSVGHLHKLGGVHQVDLRFEAAPSRCLDHILRDQPEPVDGTRSGRAGEGQHRIEGHGVEDVQAQVKVGAAGVVEILKADHLRWKLRAIQLSNRYAAY